MTDFRTKFIIDNLRLCRDNAEELTDWESDFILDIVERFGVDLEEGRVPSWVSTAQFNKIHSIAQDLKKRKQQARASFSRTVFRRRAS